MDNLIELGNKTPVWNEGELLNSIKQRSQIYNFKEMEINDFQLSITESQI